MPIRFIDKTGQLGQLSSVLADAVSAIAGTRTLPAGRTGTIGSQLGSHVSAFSGAFQANADRTGTIGATLADHTASIVGTPPVAASTGIRFNPGHYMNVDVGSGGGGLAGWISQINSIADEPTIKGVKVALNWDDVEPTAQGTYSFTIMDQLVNACAAINKKLMLIISSQYFSTSVTNPAGRLPTYVINNGWYWQWDGTGTPAGNLALAIRLDLTACMNAFIAMGQACAARYNTGGTVELWMIGETAMDVPSSTGWTTANWIARLKSWGAAMRTAWSQTGVRIYTNYLDTDAQMQDLIAFCAVNKITCGGPDNYSRIYQSNPIYTGNNGGINYRDVIPWASENQRPANSSGGETATSAQIYAHNETGALVDGGSTKPNYYVWYKPYLGETWAQVLAFIQSISGACNTTTPGSYLGFQYFISTTGSDSNDGRATTRPWTIAALNTKRTTYRGNRVGLLDGTYNINTLIQAGDGGGYEPALNIDGGTGAGSTVIQAVNERLAIIECRAGGTTHPTRNNPAIGQYGTSQTGYVELRGLVIRGAGSKGIYLGNYGVAATTATRYDGFVVDSCEITAQSCATFASGGNFACLESAGMRGGQVTNNYFHTNVGNLSAKNGNHYSSALQWFGEGNLYEYNTVVDSPGFYGKEHGNFGSIVRYNHIDTTGWTETWGLEDFGDDAAVVTGSPTLIHNNILIAPQAADLRSTLSGASPFKDALTFHHNTLIMKSGPASLGLAGHFDAGLLSCYGNIIYSEASGDLTMICVNTSADGIINYDLYYSSTGNYVYGSFSSTTSSTRNTTSNFATWQSTMGGTPEANSVRGSNPLFVATGARSLYYQLQSGSPAKNASKSNGTSGGTTCDMGAWGGPSPPSRIGCDF